MSWLEVEKVTSSAGRALKPPVTMTGGGTKAKGDKIVLNVRPSMIDDLVWWRKDTRVRIMIGQGDNAGDIRVTPDAKGMFRLHVINSHKASDHPTVTLSFSAPKGTAPLSFAQCEVEFEYSDKWLDVTIPAAAHPKPAALPDAKAAVAPGAAQKGPFRTGATSPGLRPATGGR